MNTNTYNNIPAQTGRNDEIRAWLKKNNVAQYEGGDQLGAKITLLNDGRIVADYNRKPLNLIRTEATVTKGTTTSVDENYVTLTDPDGNSEEICVAYNDGMRLVADIDSLAN